MSGIISNLHNQAGKKMIIMLTDTCGCNGMKKLVSLILLSVFASCGILKQPASLQEEEEIIILRKYIGLYLDYRHTGPEDLAGTNIIWIKTSMENVYGKISALGRKCEFTAGERLYLRRTLYDPGIGAGYWVYHVENDSSVYYEATEFQHDHKVSIETWFQNSF